MKKEKNKKALYIVIIGIIVLIGIGGCYLFYNNNKEEQINIPNNEKINDTDKKEDSKKYIFLFNGEKKILKSDLNLTEYAKINSSKVDASTDIVFLDIIEPDFQFETHYLFCFDKDGKLILDVRDYKDSDNDNNRYKFNGDFDYDESNNILTFYTNLFLGDGEESAGAAFDGKDISELTNAEKTILGNYSDLVKYDYKYENNKIKFVEKTEVNKLKDNIYYKDLLSSK